MKKKSIKMIAILFALSMLLSSCYGYRSVVGEGSKGNNERTEWNHYLLGGLIPIGSSDSHQMSDGAENYTVRTRQSFLNILVTGITGGLYATSTTTVSK